MRIVFDSSGEQKVDQSRLESLRVKMVVAFNVCNIKI